MTYTKKELIEAIAIGVYDEDCEGMNFGPWGHRSEDTQDDYRQGVEAILDKLEPLGLGVVPLVVEPGDVGPAVLLAWLREINCSVNAEDVVEDWNLAAPALNVLGEKE